MGWVVTRTLPKCKASVVKLRDLITMLLCETTYLMNCLTNRRDRRVKVSLANSYLEVLFWTTTLELHSLVQQTLVRRVLVNRVTVIDNMYRTTQTRTMWASHRAQVVGKITLETVLVGLAEKRLWVIILVVNSNQKIENSGPSYYFL